MLELTRTTIGIAAGVAGTVFLGYCIYFDQQRRKDPDFKKKVRERRAAAKNSMRGSSTVGTMVFPDPSDHEAMQRFFLQQVQLGEELLAAGDLEAGVEHLGLAVAVCGQTQQLLAVLQQTLPAPIFHLLLQKLPIVNERLRQTMAHNPSKTAQNVSNGDKPTSTTLREEEVE